MYPEGVVEAGNRCRSPDGEVQPWCYSGKTSTGVKVMCPVHFQICGNNDIHNVVHKDVHINEASKPTIVQLENKKQSYLSPVGPRTNEVGLPHPEALALVSTS